MTRTSAIATILVFIAVASGYSQQVDVWHVVDFPNTRSGTGVEHRILAAAAPDDIAIMTIATDNGRNDHELRLSYDSGTSWLEVLAEHSGPTRWWSVQHPDEATLMIVGDSDVNLGSFGGNTAYRFYGMFYFSSNAGESWTKRLLDSNSIIYDACMHNSLEGAMIVGYPGNIYDSAAARNHDSLLVTKDGWKSWTAHALPEGSIGCWELEALGLNSYITYSVYPETFYVTTDDGEHWDTRATLDWGIRQIVVLSPTHIFAVGGNYGADNRVHGLMYESNDGARSWITRIDSAMVTAGFTSIAFGDTLHGIAVGDAILRTNDGCQTWSRDDMPAELGIYPRPARYLVMPTDSLALAVQQQDQLLRFAGEMTLKAPVFIPMTPPGPLPLGSKTIRWTKIIGATAYRLQLTGRDISQNTYDSTLFGTPILDTLVSDTSIVYNAKLANFGYWVRVEAINAEEHSNWTVKASLFYTVSRVGKPLPPDIIYPEIGAHVNKSITLGWNQIDGAVAYQLRLWFENGFRMLDTMVNDTFVTISNLKGPDLYSVTVRVLLANDTSDWSNGDYYFYTEAAGVEASEQVSTEVYPNPASAQFRVRLPITHSEKLYLLDLLGNRVAAATSTDGEAVLDVRSLPAGSYIVVSEDRTFIRRVAVVH